jgi:hypothetical protein
MAETLEITAGQNRFDPLGDFFRDAARPDENQQDPAVQERCGQVFKEVVTLCCRYTDGRPPDTLSDNKLVWLTTPHVRYKSTEPGDGQTVDGHVWFETSLPYESDSLCIDYQSAETTLWYQANDPNTGTRKRSGSLIQLSPDAIFYNSLAGMRAGGNPELNYFRGIVDKVRTAAFPKDPAEAVEKGHEVAAARVRAARAAAEGTQESV